MSDGYTITDKRRASLRGFRRTLPRQGSALRICPPDCTERHDAGKHAGRDHWKPWPTPKRA
jgi:hypothetical protein